MWEAKLEPNVISCSAGISVCEKGKEWQRALALLSKMEDAKLRPNTIGDSDETSACEKGELLQRASVQLDEMRGTTLESSVITETRSNGKVKPEEADLTLHASAGTTDDPARCIGHARNRVCPTGVHVLKRRNGSKRTYSTNHVRRGSVVTTAEVAVSQQWIRKRSPGNVEDAAGVGAVGGLTFFTDVVKSHVDESGTLTRIDFREVKPGVSTDHMKQAMGALFFISWAIRERPPPVPTKLFLDLPEDIHEEVRHCFESLGVEICVWPDMPTSVAASPPAEPRARRASSDSGL
ncbi:unnamed protein product [Prorocentrum cordatum]|uniref:Pentatricopeptide repeat-containing protein n=1 Tax=Prorocentrum cordatum TaxID=2364126 RepID=A0ABN9S357_9DINO|nr:unnamed protein product [Polarella glacialis]